MENNNADISYISPPYRWKAYHDGLLVGSGTLPGNCQTPLDTVTEERVAIHKNNMTDNAESLNVEAAITEQLPVLGESSTDSLVESEPASVEIETRPPVVLTPEDGMKVIKPYDPVQLLVESFERAKMGWQDKGKSEEYRATCRKMGDMALAALYTMKTGRNERLESLREAASIQAMNIGSRAVRMYDKIHSIVDKSFSNAENFDYMNGWWLQPESELSRGLTDGAVVEEKPVG
jgi:hypothetical protein